MCFEIKAGCGDIEPYEGESVHVDMATLRKSGVPSLSEGQLVVYDLAYLRGHTVAENLRVL